MTQSDTPRPLPGTATACPGCGVSVIHATTTASPAGPGGRRIQLAALEHPEGTYAAVERHRGAVVARPLEPGEAPEGPWVYQAAAHDCPNASDPDALAGPLSAEHPPPGTRPPRARRKAARRPRGGPHIPRCHDCDAVIVWYRSPHTGHWRAFDPTPVPPGGDGTGRIAYPVEGQRAWKTHALVEDLQARRPITPAEAEQEVADLPHHTTHLCPERPTGGDGS